MKILLSGLILFFIHATAHAGGPPPVLGWNVDCGNHCSFNEFPNNCQGVFYYYADGTRSYATWSSSYNACQEFAPLQGNTHIISPSLIQCGCPTPAATPPAINAPLSNNTRSQLEILRSQINSWAVCLPDPSSTYPDVQKPYSAKNLNTCQYYRKNNLKHAFMNVGGCYKGMQGFDDSNGWHPCTHPGDQLSNVMVNCLMGETDRCNEAKDSQDPVTGQWYRNPYARRHPETSLGQPLSSRDVMMGILAYVAYSKDKEALRKWLVAIKNNPKAPPLNLYSLCPPRPNVGKPDGVPQKEWDTMIPDDRCGIVPDAAGLIYKVALYVGFTNTELYNLDAGLYSALSSGSTTVYSSVASSAASAPATSYQIGNVADTIFLLRFMEGTGNTSVTAAANSVNTRTARLNPSYHYLEMKGTPTEYGAYLINKYCKSPRPQWGSWYSSGYHHDGNSTGVWYLADVLHVSGYQFWGGYEPSGQKLLPTGHECLAWLNMYLGNANRTEAKCDDGDVFVNGACRKYLFTAPKLAAVNGIGYKFRNGDAKLTYTAIDLKDCPYGGTLEVSPNWPDFFRCALPSGLSTNQIVWNQSYLVDPTESAPMIYYNKINNGCPNGGYASGSRCVVMNYEKPKLLQSVRYWVDANAAIPGIYYQKVNSSCPYGGTAAGANCLLQGFESGFLKTSRTYFTRSNPAYPGIYYYPASVIPEVKVGKVRPTGEAVKAGVFKATGAN